MFLAAPLAMACRIDVQQGVASLIVSVAGRLEDVHVSDLLEACAAAPQESLVIDLTDLLSADDSAVAALRQLKGGRAKLLGVPKYLELQIDRCR